MSHGLSTTFRALAQCETDAATRVLQAALEAPETAVQEGALEAVLRRRDPAGQRSLLERWDQLDDNWKEIIRRHRDRIARVLRDALVGSDPALCVRGCRAAVWLQAYDLIPALLTALGEPVDVNADLIAATLLGLTEQLYTELAASTTVRGGRDPQMVRQHVVGSLEGAVLRYARHRRREVIEAFLMLANRDNVALKQILQEPHHGSFPVVIEMLLASTRGGVMRLLLSFLDDPHAPTAVLAAVGNRSDRGFVRYLLRKIGREPSAAVRQNLKRITSVAWLRPAERCLDDLDDAAQHAVARLVMGSGVPRAEAFSMLDYLLQSGKPGGRRAAAEALSEFHGAEANALALRAMDDTDPSVQAAVLSQLRRRGIPGALGRLVEMLESPHAVVRQAARKSLAEFNFKQFLVSFEMLDENIRRSTGILVRKVDPHAVPLLQAEMQSKSRTRRLRSLAVAQAMDALAALESDVISLLQDDDHLVRIEAAAVLAGSMSEPSRLALQDATNDHSGAVQEAARKSLQARNQFTEWRAATADPRD